jgi:catechol 2,3-dioxygenase-like lactoylglutathione lyase family enzyme
MIRGVHAMFYSDQAEAARAFLRDRLGLPSTDVGEGWLMFDLPEVELGCHPTGQGPPAGTHDVSFTCDDLERTVTELRGRGVEFEGDIVDRGYGKVIHLVVPGGVKVELFQARYARRGDERRSHVQAFLERYAVALSRGDLKTISASWVLPGLVVSDQGAVAVSGREQIETFMAGAQLQYRSEGIAYTRPELKRLEPLSDGLVACDVDWPLITPDGVVKGKESGRYLLQGAGASLAIRCVVMLGAS